ncbi:hypothetical protein SCP_0601410 [Sparassis crispa]|uniref:Uncharacterized protein n=1 Tax=Sparassis crispa TaxID=139825 RepID=A0A401GPL5_9APHY|nr:hypothetical protein SCP_0601410 [Sparassis crispa]GBE84163.1 hypothetical protein SCP_0601410 [Sparassis crispa]
MNASSICTEIIGQRDPLARCRHYISKTNISTMSFLVFTEMHISQKMRTAEDLGLAGVCIRRILPPRSVGESFPALTLFPTVDHNCCK